MDEIYVQSQVYPNFEGYIINKNKSVARYEYNSSEPINCHLGKSKMSTCACGGSVVPLAYVFETEKREKQIYCWGKSVLNAEITILQKKQYHYSQVLLILRMFNVMKRNRKVF